MPAVPIAHPHSITSRMRRRWRPELPLGAAQGGACEGSGFLGCKEGRPAGAADEELAGGRSVPASQDEQLLCAGDGAFPDQGRHSAVAGHRRGRGGIGRVGIQETHTVRLSTCCALVTLKTRGPQHAGPSFIIKCHSLRAVFECMYSCCINHTMKLIFAFCCTVGSRCFNPSKCCPWSSLFWCRHSCETWYWGLRCSESQVSYFDKHVAAGALAWLVKMTNTAVFVRLLVYTQLSLMNIVWGEWAPLIVVACRRYWHQAGCPFF